MSLSIFDEKAFVPNDELLSEALLDKKSLWDEILNHINASYGNISKEWKFYSKSAGWTLVIKSGKRTLLYLIPLNAYFKVNFVYGEKAVLEAQKANLPESILTAILEAKPYVEGRSFMTDVKIEADVKLIQRLLEIKVEY